MELLQNLTNLTIGNKNGATNCTTFWIEAAVHGDKKVLSLVDKYMHPLTVCYDMGWQHHSLGSAYNSMSGHAFLIGANSNKILKQIVFFRKLLHMHKERMERPRVCCDIEGS